MPIEQIVAILVAERDRINRAIEALQGGKRGRGRPPKNPLASPLIVSGTKRRGRTAEQKRAQSEKMKKYWAQRKKQEK